MSTGRPGDPGDRSGSGMLQPRLTDSSLSTGSDARMQIIQVTRTLATGLLLIVLTLGGGGPLAGQPGLTRVPVTAAVPELLAGYEAEVRGDKADRSATRDLGYLLLTHAEHPPQTIGALLAGLERLALTSDHPLVRSGAAQRLGRPGSEENARPRRGTVARLERVYRQSHHLDVRGVIVITMARQAERRQAVAFLRAIAVKPRDQQDFPGSASAALISLAALGDEGRAVLRELHQHQLVQDADARFELSEFAKRNYRYEWRPSPN